MTPESHQARPVRKSASVEKYMTQPVITGVVVAVIAGVAFMSGVQYQKRKTTTAKAVVTTNASVPQFNGGAAAGGVPSGARRGRGGVFGTVSAVSDSSITVTNSRTNADQTLSITSATVITNSGATASVSDIQSGDSVVITPDTSDSTVAARIMVNPAFPGGMGGGPAGGGGIQAQ